jgi:hypothetical protein
MTPVKQEFIHDPANGVYGDCQRAVIASLLDLPIQEVPHFLGESKNDAVGYWTLLQKFLRDKGYAWLVVPAKSGAAFFGAEEESIYHEISGPSPRGSCLTHAVVGCDGKIVFDPHPSNAGLVGDPSEWEYAYLVKTCEDTASQVVATCDVEGKSEALAIAIYEAVNSDASERTPWTYLPPSEWSKWRHAANLLKYK